MAQLHHCLLGVNYFLPAAILIAFLLTANGFSYSGYRHATSIFHQPDRAGCRQTKGGNLYMGRHAVVRALTKAKTDGAKSKNNSR